MEKETLEYINIFIPTSILGDSSLTSLEKLILIEIVSLSKKEGYCWAKNKHFMDMFNVTKQTVSKSISSLSKNNYIKLEYIERDINVSKRKIIPSGVLKNFLTGIQKKYNSSIQKNFNQYNNKLNNNKNNIMSSIIGVDTDGTMKWHEQRCEENLATIEEQEKLKRRIESFKKKRREINK